MADEWFGVGKKDTYSIKEIVMQHIRGISELARKEFTPSYWQKKPMKVGDGIAMSETYHEDKRLAYCNAIDFLLDLMMPHADKDFKEVLEKMNEEEDEKFKKHEEEKKSEDAWIWVKLSYRRKLFGQLMLMITRIKFFEFIPYIDTGEFDDDEEELNELEQKE
jgi:hypothetical protein